MRIILIREYPLTDSDFETPDKVGNIIFLKDLEDDKKFRLVK